MLPFLKVLARRTAALALMAVAAVGCGGDSGGGFVPQPPAQVRLGDVQAQIFTPTCAISGCHTGSGSPFGFALDDGATFGNSVNVASSEVPGLLRVEPFNSTDSYIYMKVTSDPRILGDPMPAFGAGLTPTQVQLLEDWIDQGAQQ